MNGSQGRGIKVDVSMVVDSGGEEEIESGGGGGLVVRMCLGVGKVGVGRCVSNMVWLGRKMYLRKDLLVILQQFIIYFYIH